MIPMQDVLGLKDTGRINDPADPSADNWSWKLKDFKAFPAELEKIHGWLEAAGRLGDGSASAAEEEIIIEEEIEEDE